MFLCNGAIINIPSQTSKKSGNLELVDWYIFILQLLFSSSLTCGSIIVLGSKLFISTNGGIFWINFGAVFVTIIFIRNYLDMYLLEIAPKTVKVPNDSFLLGLM
jgi:hypothetical protein